MSSVWEISIRSPLLAKDFMLITYTGTYSRMNINLSISLYDSILPICGGGEIE